jgi:uncharacterized protein YdaU (DUF1376 family)
MARMMGLLWWIDRWRTSAAFREMTLEEQGAYRNLLDEAYLCGGVLPNDERRLAKACGDGSRWPAVREAVLAKFVLTPLGWQNTTLTTVLHESRIRAERQRRYRASTGNPVASTPEHRTREAARGTARRALARGQLVRQPCEVCGADTVEMHHDDYQKPLDVRWLCKRHHDEYHNQIVPLRHRS